MSNIRIICKGNTLEGVQIVDADSGKPIKNVMNVNISIDAIDGVTADITFLNPELDVDIEFSEDADDEATTESN